VWNRRPDRDAADTPALPAAAKATLASTGDAAPADDATIGEPLDSTKLPLRYVLRTQAGAGPLDLLKLRGFRMPERIFITGRVGQIAGLPSLPPLPPELQQ
jgi:type VI secretion system protein ImpL